MQYVPAISFKDVSFSFSDHLVIDNANVEVNQREFVTVVGPNGSGKTTFLKLILGFHRPSKGYVKVFNQHPHEARSIVGYMPQHARLDPMFPISVMDVTLMGRLGKGPTIFGYTAKDREVVEKILRQLHMWEHRKERFSELSDGQRQRTLIARALAVEPRLLLLDEPTAGLDCVVEDELLDLLNELAREITVIMVSHELSFVSKHVDKVICVKTHVHIHPTSEITSETLEDFYGPSIRQVRHDLAHHGGFNRC